jgi:hypothetical protein
MASDVLKTVLAGGSGEDAIKKHVKRAAMSEAEKELKNFLLKKGVSSELLGAVSLSDVLKKTDQLKNLSDDEIWSALKKIMAEKAGLSPEVADLVINVMKENGVSFEDLKGVLGDKGLREDTLKDALQYMNPKAARLIAENPGCLRIFDLFKGKNDLSMQDVISVVTECQQAREAWSAPEPSDSDGDFSDDYGRRRTLSSGQKLLRSSDSEEEDSEEEEEQVQEEDDEDEEEGDEGDDGDDEDEEEGDEGDDGDEGDEGDDEDDERDDDGVRVRGADDEEEDEGEFLEYSSDD